jgi:hypothetical protein
MQILARCPQCGCSWRLDAIAADRRIRCRKCNKLFKIPRLEDIPEATETIERAKGPIYVDEKGKTYG